VHTHTKNKNRLEQIINEILSLIEKDIFTMREWVHACYVYGYGDERTIRKYLNIALDLGLIEYLTFMRFRKAKKRI
jgi:methylphosphotriester-DNA--protein-cysteine methyltransferase